MESRETTHSLGVDVSHYQGAVRWNEVATSGIDFAYIKASEGSGVDDYFYRNAAGAKAAGLYTGAYHFLDANDEAGGRAEAEHFWSVVQNTNLDLPLVVDVEDKRNTKESALAFVNRITELSGMRPIVYTYPSFIDEVIGNSLSGLCELWYADYSHNQPADRGGWTEWLFLQYSEHGHVPGIDSPVDVDEFNGRLSDVFAGFRELQQQVANLTKTVSDINARLDQDEALLKSTDAPKWFIDEFGPDALKNIVNDPHGDHDFWRMMAIDLRQKKQGGTNA